jgi:hypothetical protein
MTETTNNAIKLLISFPPPSLDLLAHVYNPQLRHYQGAIAPNVWHSSIASQTSYGIRKVAGALKLRQQVFRRDISKNGARKALSVSVPPSEAVIAEPCPTAIVQCSKMTVRDLPVSRVDAR